METNFGIITKVRTQKTPKKFRNYILRVKMDFLGLEKIFEMGPTELAEMESTSTIDFKKNPKKSKEA